MKNDSDRGVDRKCDAVYQRVGDANGHYAERTESEALSWEDLDEFSVIQEPMFFQFAFDIGEGELCAVNGYVEFGEDPGKATDVIFVTVGEHDAANHRTVFDEVGDVGDDNVDSEEFFFGEHQTGVDYENVVTKAEGKAVHTELTEPA